MPRIATAGLCLLALAAVVLGRPAVSPEGSSARASATGVPARAAHAFTESIGVNTHTYYTDSVYYRRFATIERRLRELGIHHIRENLVPHRPDAYRRLRRLAAAGIKSTLIVGEPRNGLGEMRRLVRILATQLGGSVDAAEGPNEFDLSGERGWSRGLARYQRALYRAVRSNPRLAGLPVVGPSMGQPDDASDLGGLSAFLDFGNIHSYPNGEPPEWNVAESLATERQVSAAKAVIATETGYHDAVRARTGQQPASDAAAAIYLPRLFLDYFSSGIRRTFAYELVDEHPNPAKNDLESNFGLLRHDLSPKPAFLAIRNLIAILEDPGGSFAPGRLDYSIAGATGDLHQILLEKRDGRFYLALWRRDSVWDPYARRALRLGSPAVRISFGSAPLSLREYLPNVSAGPVRALSTNAGTTSVEVGPRVVIVEVQPG